MVAVTKKKQISEAYLASDIPISARDKYAIVVQFKLVDRCVFLSATSSRRKKLRYKFSDQVYDKISSIVKLQKQKKINSARLPKSNHKRQKSKPKRIKFKSLEAHKTSKPVMSETAAMAKVIRFVLVWLPEWSRMIKRCEQIFILIEIEYFRTHCTFAQKDIIGNF